jgi:hypothetical protein
MNLLKVETDGGTWKTRKVRDLLRSKLRYAGRILVEMRKELPETTMFDALQVKHVDLIVEATRRCAVDANGVESFETRIKMGQVLSACMKRRRIMGLKTMNMEVVEETESLMKVYEEDWPKLISKPARIEMSKKAENKLITIPTTETIVKFASGLKERLETAIVEFQTDTSHRWRYRRLQNVLLIRTIQLNRRRGLVRFFIEYMV